MLLSGNLLFFEQDFMLRLLSLLQKCSELHGQFLSDDLTGSFPQPETTLRSQLSEFTYYLSIVATHLSC